jgi:uncharacterized membrane protein
MFEKNESGLDRIVRTVVGGGLLVSALTTFGLGATRPAGVVLGLVGVVLLFTAATGSCPLYRLLGTGTARQH